MRFLSPWDAEPLAGSTKDTMAVALDAMLARVKDVCKRNGLLILSVLSVIVGCLLGFFLRTRRLSPQVSDKTGGGDCIKKGDTDIRWKVYIVSLLSSSIITIFVH